VKPLLYQIIVTKELGDAMQDNALTTRDFLFRDLPVRVLDRDGQVWFVADDVAKALAYRTANDMTRLLDEDEKGTHNVRTLGGNQQVAILSESGLYHAILKSRKPQARPFRRWVTEEVLPTIRKTGRYEARGLMLPETIRHLIEQKGINTFRPVPVLDVDGDPWFRAQHLGLAVGFFRGVYKRVSPDNTRKLGKFFVDKGVEWDHYINANGVVELVLSMQGSFRSWLASTAAGTSSDLQDFDKGWSLIGMLASYRELYNRYFDCSETFGRDVYERRLYVQRMLREHHEMDVYPAHVDQPDIQNPLHLRQVLDEFVLSILFLETPFAYGCGGVMASSVRCMLRKDTHWVDKQWLAKYLADQGMSVVERGGAHYLAVRTDHKHLVSRVSKIFPYDLSGDRWAFYLRSIQGAIEEAKVPLKGNRTSGTFSCVLVPVSEIAISVPNLLDQPITHKMQSLPAPRSTV